MKKVLLFLFILLISCSGSKSIHGNIRIWNGKADTNWYEKSETEFTITTPEQLAGLAKLVNGGNDFYGKTVKLGANIMLNDTADWQNWASKPPRNEWKPIGTYIDKVGERTPDFFRGHTGRALEYFLVPEFIQRALRMASTSFPFSGTFDGGGFAVSGMYVNNSDDYQGLFGYIRMLKYTYKEWPELRNLGIRASYIKGRRAVGGLVGKSEGTVSGCYSTAWVAGEGAGGLAGYLIEDAIITNSYSTGTVTGGNYVGGLAGGNRGTISDSYSTGMVIGVSHVGGLVGTNSGTIISSYSAGAVAGDGLVGGLVGSSSYIRTTTNSYYNMETSGQSKGIGKIENGPTKAIGIGKAEGKNTPEMKRKKTFIDWDFDKIWGIDSTVNDGYPHLRSILRKVE
jgi:hypothetical protein